ncbi:alkanesulfonate monooxygenase SsuD/methylene tetrahydromethanopterin reductase-like flavin-dependent oxidoreductase (luciferase family) [Crossiella equi]|uniref:Alkanesulfonate monooxygenase SsuD/methylene tetrahydromethanopterin reductase-like flavin-dependent oxidoreductase (Luciferase family) n=1 Tax=Crossiella equi TaxID=130796 RepID=A0ABS5ASL0_9PSEU|nr:LLM class flavin-dependent oxidoreductase [Crossiella equi]MBP2479207.1 alkanesulfonate monooxygenase SsuD/methylene tetrahydromethanopterin reductase-like flavin-dependent oxidoreductase (luciferase family) [Crossiella equi]
MPLRLGLTWCPPESVDLPTRIELARAAEEVGFDWLLHVGGQEDPHLAALVWAPVLMAATRRIEVVTTLHTRYLPPAVLARLGANMDVLSEGRWAWHVVAGPAEDPAGGLRPLTAPERDRHAAETVRAVKEIWRARGGELDFDGEFYRLSGRLPGPHPVRQPRPPLFTGELAPAVVSECDYALVPLAQVDAALVQRLAGRVVATVEATAPAAELAERLLAVHRRTGLHGFQLRPTGWSADRLRALGEVFTYLTEAGARTEPGTS